MRVCEREMIVTMNLHHWQRKDGALLVLLSTAESQVEHGIKKKSSGRSNDYQCEFIIY